ncbi:MAG: hypothetical protein IPH75_02390 [bacterium]|nr:hypothetical protein [bacterium]
MIRRVLLSLSILLLSGSLLAENFVSFRGKFYISYPAEWKQIDYLTVDAYLRQAGARRRTLDYEAVFAPTASEPWYHDSYFILTVDTLPGLTDKQIDSIIVGFEDTFEKPREIKPSATLLNNLSYGKIAWDPSSKTAAVLSEEADSASGGKATLLVMHFYEGGIANYFYYATDSAFSLNLPVLSSVVASFTTENVQSVIPRETSKIADPDKISKATESKGSKTAIWAPTSGAVVVILIIALAARRKKRQRQS